MRGSTNKDKLVLGMDMRYRPDDYTASEITNFRVEDEGYGWKNDRGWEPLIPYGSIVAILKNNLGQYKYPHRFLAIYNRHQDAEQYYLYEQGGRLLYEFGNQNTSTEGIVQLQPLTRRYTPKPNEPGTQLAPYGWFALILNGHDCPLLFGGRERIRTFGWTNRPASPSILGVQPSHINPTYRLDGESVALRFPPTGYIGLGIPDNGSSNRFGYRLSFISDTGSESPMSIPVFATWKIESTAAEAKMGVLLDELPIGPEGTIARKLYRTKNLTIGEINSEVYYELDIIKDNCSKQYVDIHPDSYLIYEADVQSSSPISHDYQYATEFNGHMWLATGTKIIYSKQGLPEQFPDFNYFNVGIRDGGYITGLHQLGNSLIVFRTSSIDIISTAGTNNNGDPTYFCETLDSNVGTIATNTIKSVPGFGLVFLSPDGFYSIRGSQKGGGMFKIEKISVGLEKELRRLSITALARATAAYSPREKEYWCHYPVDGETENSRGAVLSTLTGKWHLRNTMPFTQLATDAQGWFIIGHIPTKSASYTDWTAWPGYGLQVWSAYYSWGHDFTYSASDNDYHYYTYTGHPKDLSVWVSTWEDVTDDSVKKRVLSVEIEILTQGNNPIECSYAIDGNWTWTSAGNKTPQVPEYDNSAYTETVYGTTAVTGTAVWGTSKWEGGKRTRLVFDIGSTLCSTFRFKLESLDLMHILNYKLLYVEEKNHRTLRR